MCGELLPCKQESKLVHVAEPPPTTKFQGDGSATFRKGGKWLAARLATDMRELWTSASMTAFDRGGVDDRLHVRASEEVGHAQVDSLLVAASTTCQQLSSLFMPMYYASSTTGQG
ncbi:hypothetical protein [Streptomyces sp. NPDC059215]|uniref:hypothetical protein n=1 Tax=Streptomyces sp. NPDC059215 TaxID=3346772 RepID=UPI0036C82AFA